ncbi:MAG: GNAT family N-acetyltransferase [Nocardioidaceae bacterium]
MAPQWCTDLLHNPDALVRVASSDEGVVGHLIGSFSSTSDIWLEPRAELLRMRVKRNYRSRGLGSHLVEGFKEWARERGAARLHVTAYIANQMPSTTTRFSSTWTLDMRPESKIP